MAVNFDELPNSNPNNIPDAGYYLFQITKAEMRKPKTDLTKPEYASLTLALTNAKGRHCGNLFEMLTESTYPALMFKMKRFCEAVGLDLHGSVELRDICRAVTPRTDPVTHKTTGRTGVVEIEQVADKQRPGEFRAQVKLFGSECYWPASEFASLIGASGAAPDPANEDVPFDFSDDEDADIPTNPASEPGDSEY